jgi:hypothetical protein
MQSIRRGWRRIVEDFRARRNLDVYVVTFFAVLFAVITLVDDVVPENAKTAVIMAALGLLVFNISTDQKTATNLDDFLDDRTQFKPFKEYIAQAQTLWIYAPSGANLLNGETAEVIRRTVLAHPQGELRAIIQNPEKTDAVEILSEQLDKSLDFQVQSIGAEIQRTIGQLQLIRSWPKTGRFEYRLLDYGPGFSLIVIDGHKRSGMVIVEFHGFHNESTNARMHLILTLENSERWFLYWASQFEYMWKAAQEPKV